jgi:hypothetical protein
VISGPRGEEGEIADHNESFRERIGVARRDVLKQFKVSRQQAAIFQSLDRAQAATATGNGTLRA